MSKSICVAQSIEEIEFILGKVKKKTIFLPLNLSTQLYCIKNSIKFYNPLNFINNSFYKEALFQSEKLINSLKFGDIASDSHRKEFKAFIRFRFNSIAFLLELITKIKKKEKIDTIIVSGWDRYYEQFSIKNYFVSYLIVKLFNDINIISLEKLKHQNYNTNNLCQFSIKKNTLNKNKKNIILTNLGYNFFKIILELKKKRVNIIVPSLGKMNIFKKFIYKILNIKFFEFEKKKIGRLQTIKIPKIKFKYRNKNLSEVLNFRVNQEKNNILKLIEQSKAIKDFFKNTKINLVITNVTKGIYGYFIDIAKISKVDSVCIPHGTLSKNFNLYDKIYKKIISEPIISKNSKYQISQTNIAKNFFKSRKKYNNILHTGNLIFAENLKDKKINKDILFAVTLKDFHNIQFFGVEMYYEFIDNLFFLENLSKKHNFKFLVNLHPSAYDNLQDLENLFTNIKFIRKNIEKALSSVFVTISFSSTAIEDSLISNCPVILLDRWKRYKHCLAEENIKKKNSAIYYVNNEKQFIKCIETISNSKKINFSKYLLNNSRKANIKNFISKLIN